MRRERKTTERIFLNKNILNKRILSCNKGKNLGNRFPSFLPTHTQINTFSKREWKLPWCVQEENWEATTLPFSAGMSVLQYVCVCAQSCLTLHLCPWDFPGEGTGVGCHFLLQGIFLTQESNLCLLHWQLDSLLLSHWGSP